MTDQRPRLILVQGSSSLSPGQMQYLKSAFDVVEVENIASARTQARLDPEAILAPELIGGNGELAKTTIGIEALEHIAEGAAVVDGSGTIAWANQRMMGYSNETQREFAGKCLEAIDLFNRNGETDLSAGQPGCLRFAFHGGNDYYEVAISPTATDPEPAGRVIGVIGVMWNITARRTLQAKIDAIDAAGSELMRLEPSEITKLNMAERLNLIEEKIVRYVNEVLDFNNFEIRLLNRETNQLELVISRGIAPLKVGEVMFAEKTGNGISGLVAVTGESYVCPDVRRDPLYREGLDNAGSSLTVPLKLYDRIIGVFNAESNSPDVFGPDDQQFAEIFGRYIATAMNILDLLVVERYTTNEQITQNVLGELNQPLVQITTEAQALKGAKSAKARREHLEHIVEAASGIKSRLEACASGPRSILGAEEEMRRLDVDPNLRGKRVLVADDEEGIRETLADLLTQKGCCVTKCSTGDDTIRTLHQSREDDTVFDLVITDIKLPGCNGYEIFHTAKEVNEDTPVILMTGFGYDPNHSIVRASQEGLHSFLFKPFKANQLMELVEKAFQPAEVQ